MKDHKSNSDCEQARARKLVRDLINGISIKTKTSKSHIARGMGITRFSVNGYFNSDRNITINSLAGLLYQMGYRIESLDLAPLSSSVLQEETTEYSVDS